RPERYAEFWKYVEKYLEEHAAVDDRWHGTVVHLSHAISVQDLIAQVTKICPPDTSIPSKQWLRMQFSPNNETVKVSEYYTERLNIKYIVQARQLRVDHPDFHYASVLFRYEREMAVRYREYSNLIFMDDKHRCKVREPGYPVAAVEQGKSVIVANGATFAVADHDFTKCELIPSVIMHAKIPQLIDELFYRGKIYVGLKDLVFEPLNAARHTTELYEIARKAKLDKHKKKQRCDKQMLWTGNAQRAKNVGMTVTCMDCNKSRCLYASKKITEDEKKIFMAHLDTVCYTCGATFSQNDNGFKMELKDDSLEESSRK
ncbi:20554_t:CDS:2, partial [Rhizophagus irregularis]